MSRGYRGSYRGSYRYANDYGRERAIQHVREARELQTKYGEAFSHIRTLFLSLDKGRVSALMDAYAGQYGRSAATYASQTYYRWRSGTVKMSGQTMTRLFDLLPRFMTPAEKLELIRQLRQQTLKRLRRSSVRLTVSNPGHLTSVLEQVMGLVQRVGAIELPADFREVQGWITEADSRAMSQLLRETESYIATQRLTDLMVQLAALSRLRELAALGLRLRVTTHFEIPTATVDINFANAFWKTGDAMNSGSSGGSESDKDLIVRLQEIALRQEQQQGGLSYVQYVMRTLTEDEQRQLRAIAAAEGLRTEILLEELKVKTVAARGDIQSVMDTATKLKAEGHSSKISSEHQTASGVTRIEIDNKKSGCMGVFVLLTVLATAGSAYAATATANLFAP